MLDDLGGGELAPPPSDENDDSDESGGTGGGMGGGANFGGGFIGGLFGAENVLKRSVITNSSQSFLNW